LYVLGTKLIRKETQRSIVAVFYEEPGIVVRPSRYKLFAVANDLSQVEALPVEPRSPYWVRGRN
jgi:hypothetical protein